MEFFTQEAKEEIIIEDSKNILVWPNITFAEDLKKDSFVVVLTNLVNELSKLRKDLFWYVVTPQRIDSLILPNVEQLIIPLPSYPNTMRIHFDTETILKTLTGKEFDLIYCHLPEQATQLKNLLRNKLGCVAPFIGYAHFFEFPECVRFAADTLKYNLIGISEMDCCGINTEAQKQLALKYAQKFLSPSLVERIDKVLTIQYLGSESPSYVNRWKGDKIIVFNHRPESYKGYDWFLTVMDRLRKQRKDFKVWVPLADRLDRNYIFTKGNTTRSEYLSNLSACSVGIGGIQKYAGWSVSVTDGFSVGVPFLLADAPYYRELARDEQCFFKTDEELISKLDKILDGDRLTLSENALSRFKELSWPNLIKPFNTMINDSLETVPCLKTQTESILMIRDIIRSSGSVNLTEIKKRMGWGKGIPFARYRSALRPFVNVTQLDYRNKKPLGV